MLSLPTLVATFAYTGFGLIIFVLGFLFWDWLTPVNLWKEISEKQNNALAILAGAIAIALAIIIGSAIHG